MLCILRQSEGEARYQLSTASEAEAKRVITNWCSELHRGQTNVKSLCTSI